MGMKTGHSGSGAAWLTLAGALLALSAATAGCADEKGSTPATATATAANHATPTPALEPSATAAATPETINGVPVTTLSFDKNEAFPMGAVFYVEGGCMQCDGPATSLDRVYRDQAGTLHADRLFELKESAQGPWITGIATTEDGHGIVIGIVQPPKDPKDGSAVVPEPTTSFKQSLDGGISWTDIGSFAGWGWPMTVGDRGGSLVRRVVGSARSHSVTDYVNMPGAQSITVGSGYDPNWPMIVFGYVSALLLDPDGESLMWLPGPAGATPWFGTDLPDGGRITAAAPTPGSSSGLWAAAFWMGAGHALPQGGYLAMVKDRNGPPSTIYRWPKDTSLTWWSGAWLGPDQLVMQVTVPKGYVGQESAPLGVVTVPAIVDLRNARVRPIGEYFPERAAKLDRVQVLAVARGPVVKVQGAGDCLNVRAAPSTTAESLGCFKDGVLLPDRGETRILNGITWVGVKTAAGAPGWASAQYLDTVGRDMSEHPKTQPSGVRTGNPDIDPVLEAIDSGDPARIPAVTYFTPVPCSNNQQGLGGPPACPAGAPEGTAVEVLPSSSCEGGYQPREEFLRNPHLPVPASAKLYAVVKLRPPAQPNANWPHGQYALVYATQYAAATFGSVVHVTGGKIVNIQGGCGEGPAGILAKLDVESFVLPPR